MILLVGFTGLNSMVPQKSAGSKYRNATFEQQVAIYNVVA